MSDNKKLQTEYISSHYVIIADRDGTRKYISRDFPRTFPFTIKLNKAKKFKSQQKAEIFIDKFNLNGKYPINNTCVKKCYSKLTLWSCEAE